MSILRRWPFYAALVVPAFVVASFYWIDETWPMLVSSWWPWVLAFAVICFGLVAASWKRNRPFAMGVLISAPVTALATAVLIVWALAQNTVK